MPRTRISGWVAAAGLALAGCGESRVAPENETCMGADGARTLDYVALGMPGDEPDLQAWVTAEQHGMTRLTTRPCEPQPKTRILVVLPEARVVFADGRQGTFSDVQAGQKVSVWFAGGAAGKTRALVVERVAPWPPDSGDQAAEAPVEPTPAATPEATPAAVAEPAATPPP